MPAQAEITSIIQKNMAVDLVNGAKAGHAVCGTSSFEKPSFIKTLRNLHSLVRYCVPSTFIANLSPFLRRSHVVHLGSGLRVRLFHDLYQPFLHNATWTDWVEFFRSFLLPL